MAPLALAATCIAPIVVCAAFSLHLDTQKMLNFAAFYAFLVLPYFNKGSV